MTAAHSWPLASHFSTMLQNPRIAFRDAELKQIAIAKDRLKQPRAWSGAFATVYQGTFLNGRGSVAIRVFTSAAPERRDRYQAISEYLKRRTVSPLVGFRYADDGIRSAGDGKFYPLVTMDWVPGETLFKWTRRQCLDRNSQALARAAERWIELVGQLSAARIAHGDLQHANVMVTDRGELKLVDYDCMCVPALVGRKNLEIGVEPYQHPARDHDTPLSLELDHYSALFILTALKALAAAPNLWNAYIEEPQYDKLLFRREDLDEPGRSPLMKTLRNSPDPEVARLCQHLVELRRVSLEETPRLEDLLFSFSSVEKLLAARDFDAAIDMLSRAKKAPSDAPAALQPRLRDAQERIKRLAELERAVKAGDEAAMQRLYQPQLFDDYPKAKAAAAVAKDAARVLPILSQLEEAKRQQAWRRFVDVWEKHQSLLTGRASTARVEPDVRAWRERNQACDTLLTLIRQPACDAGALTLAWNKLVSLGGHPEIEPERSKIEALLKRHRAWAGFLKAIAKPGQAADEQLTQAWNEPLFAGWSTAERERPRVIAARQRLELVQRLKRAAAAPPSVACEEELTGTAGALPADYEYELKGRVQAARERLQLLDKLNSALVEPASDLEIAAQWERLEKLEGASLVPASQRGRVLQAAERAPVLHILKQLPAEYPAGQAPQIDPRLLSVWNEELLDGCRDAAPWRAAYQLALRRKHVLEALKKAIASHDKHKIVDLVDEPCLRHYPLPAEWARAAKGALAEVKATRRLLAVVSDGSPGELREVFDSRILRANRDLFAPHAERLAQWMSSEILPAEKLGLTPPVARKSLAREAGSATTYRICWQWPEPRFSDQCLVAVCRNRPRPGDDPRRSETLLRIPVDRKSYEEGGGSRLLHVEDDWQGSYVAVWAIVDVGFQTFVSEPLVLGRLEEISSRPARWKPGGIFGGSW